MNRIRSVFSDIQMNPHFRRLVKNAGILLGGDGLGTVLGMVTFAITARALGTEHLGLLVLIDSYVQTIDALVNFQSWQFMIKYGAGALERKESMNFKALVKLGTLIDLGTSVLGCLLAIGLAQWVGEWQRWDPENIKLAMLYSVIILFNFAGIPAGLLRLFDRFKLVSAQKVFTAAVKCAGVIGAFVYHADIFGFLMVWMAAEIVGSLTLIFLGWRELRRQGYQDFMEVSLKKVFKENKGALGFLLSTNLNGSFKLGFREIDTLLVGRMLGLTDVSFYKLAKKLAHFVRRFSNTLYHAIYPELSRLWAQNELGQCKKLVRQTALVMGGLGSVAWVLFIIAGKDVLHVFFGAVFAGAYTITVLYMLSKVIALVALPLAPLMLAMGKAYVNLLIVVVSVIFYFPLLIVLIERFGLLGAGLASVLYEVLRTFFELLVIGRSLRSAVTERTGRCQV